jgi:hypothetical protein
MNDDPTTTQETESFKSWAVLELMGHRKLAGIVSEQAMFGTGLIRIDVPSGEGYSTQFYAPSALYALTPCSEELARAFAQQHQPRPVERWELPAPPEPEVQQVRRSQDHEDELEDDDERYF